MSLQLQASDPLPGLRVQDSAQWAAIQQQLQSGVSFTPLLPLGDDGGVVWIPKNGCSTIKRAWQQRRCISCFSRGGSRGAPRALASPLAQR